MQLYVKRKKLKPNFSLFNNLNKQRIMFRMIQNLKIAILKTKMSKKTIKISKINKIV